MTVTDFYNGTTKKFTVTIDYNGITPDIHLDTVKFYLKAKSSDTDVQALITATADVSNPAGSSGIASFNIASSDTNISPGKYYYEIDWTKAGGEFYVLELGQLSILKRITGL